MVRHCHSIKHDVMFMRSSHMAVGLPASHKPLGSLQAVLLPRWQRTRDVDQARACQSTQGPSRRSRKLSAVMTRGCLSLEEVRHSAAFGPVHQNVALRAGRSLPSMTALLILKSVLLVRIACSRCIDAGYCCVVCLCMCLLFTNVSPKRRLSWSRCRLESRIELTRESTYYRQSAYWRHIANTVERSKARWRCGLSPELL